VVGKPGRMERIERFGGGAAAIGIGIALTGADPRNLLLTVGGAAIVSASGLLRSEILL